VKDSNGEANLDITPTPDGNIPLPFMTKGEIFVRCKGKCLEKEHRGMVLGGEMVVGGE
jgi:hypothetical protein